MPLSRGGVFVQAAAARTPASPAGFRVRLLSRTPSLVRDAVIAFLSILTILAIALPARADTELLNASYDPTRELYRALNTAFTAFNFDYRVVVLSDCVASMYGDDLHVLGLQNVARCLGWVLSNEQFFEKVNERKTHEIQP